MSYREKLEQQFIAAQSTGSHVVTETPVAPGPNARIDRAIYEIDAVMNGYDLDTAQHVPAFMPEHMARMRSILLKFHEAPL